MLRAIIPTAIAFIVISISACAPSHGPSIQSSAAQSGLDFLPKSAEKGSLFRYYQARGGSAWRNNWTSKFDLTGVSWNHPTTATLIAPQYVVMAAHFQRSPHVPVMFHDKKGNPHERYIVASQTITGTDVAIGKLNMIVPPEIKRYRFVNAADAAVGKPVIITDQTMTLSVHCIDAISGAHIRFTNIPNLHPIYQRNLVVGDSGNPTFLLKNGELLLVETHTTGGAGAGPFYGEPQLQAAIRTTIAAMGN